MRCTGEVDAGSFVALMEELNPHASGRLLATGNVRSRSIVSIYRDSETFRTIRETKGFKGRCGRCEFKEICGGSRARAYAATGDFLETDPLCAYEPGTYKMGRYEETADLISCAKS